MTLDAASLLRKYGFGAKKSWGQNFLVDEKVYRDIVAAAGAGPEDWVVEIGAGLGTLTARLAETAGRVVAIERERDMLEVLQGELGGLGSVEIAEANALEFDYRAVAERAGRRPIVVGNLPYQIAAPILFRLLEARPAIGRIVIMVQKEMADRICARPGTDDWSVLSVMVQIVATPRTVRRVAAGAFLPAPKVTSAVVAIEPLDEPRFPVDIDGFREVVRAAFGQRRKMLRNALTSLGDGERVARTLDRAGIDGRRRGETLDLGELAHLWTAWRDAEAPSVG